MLSTDVLDAALDELIIEEEIAITDGFLTSNTDNN